MFKVYAPNIRAAFTPSFPQSSMCIRTLPLRVKFWMSAITRVFDVLEMCEVQSGAIACFASDKSKVLTGSRRPLTVSAGILNQSSLLCHHLTARVHAAGTCALDRTDPEHSLFLSCRIVPVMSPRPNIWAVRWVKSSDASLWIMSLVVLHHWSLSGFTDLHLKTWSRTSRRTSQPAVKLGLLLFSSVFNPSFGIRG